MKNFERAISPSRRLFGARADPYDADDRVLGVLPNGLLGTVTAAIIIIGIVLAVKS